MPIISVIVPIYNVSQFIERCVVSLMEQTLKDIEFIFVDDCTPDNSIEILHNVLNRYPNRSVSILRHDVNKGLASARRTGLLAAKGKYIAHCDSDDWIEPNMYQSLLEEAIKNKADIVTSVFFLEKANDTCVVNYPYQKENIEEILNPEMFGWIYGAVWNKLIRKELYTNNKILPIEGINMWEDSMLTLRLRLTSARTVIFNKPFYHYWVGERQSTFFSNNNIKKVDEMVKAVDYLDFFLKQKGLAEKATLYIAQMKLLAKEPLLSAPSWKGTKKWKEIYPNNDMNIWKLKRYSLLSKIKILLLHYLPSCLAYPVFLLRRKHR